MYYLAESNWEEVELIMNPHYSSLKDRPEWDGYYTLSEAIEWYSHLIKGDDDNYKSHRLTNIEIDGNESHNIIYDNLGNISFKYDAGSMIYNSTNPYAVRMITDVSDITSFGGSQDVTYTSFDKVKSISQDNKNLHISYGADRQRVRQTLNVGEVSKTKRYFTPRYETISTGGTTKKIHYLTSSTGLFAIFALDSNNSGTMSYVIKDHQGSLNATVTGGAVSHYNFDAWGRRRDPQTLSYDNVTASLDRGYTMHEHYDEFGLINMNGRLYDPLVGRMLSPDIVIQDEQNSQAYNRYSYCFNNPLRFTDPSGYVVRGSRGVYNWNSTMYYDIDITRSNGNSFNTDLSEDIFSPIYDVNGNFLGTTKEGFTGNVLVYSGNDNIDFSSLTETGVLEYSDMFKYDEVRSLLTGDAKSNIWTIVVSQMEGSKIYDEKFSLSSITDNKIGFNAEIKGSWAFVVKSGKIQGSDKYANVYGTTVENIQSSVIVHEWYSHMIKGNSDKYKSHRLAYKNVINFKPLWDKTTDNYKKFNLKNLLRYTQDETGRSIVDKPYRRLYELFCK